MNGIGIGNGPLAVVRNAAGAVTGLRDRSTGATMFLADVGVVDAGDAAAGRIGEVISATVAVGGALLLATGVAQTISSVSLTAGDWEVTGVVDFTPAATTSITQTVAGLSTSTAALGAQDTFVKHVQAAVVPATDYNLAAPIFRLNVSATTTLFLIAQAVFSVAALSAYGSLRARRIR